MPTPFLAPIAIALQETPAGAPQAAPGFSWTPLILILAVVYFVLIAPERKNRKKREEMLASLQKGDKVITTSGIHASVAQVQGDVVTLQVADGVRLKFTLQAVQGLIEERPAESGKDAEESKAQAKA